MNRVHGDTASLKASHARQLQKLGDRSVPPDQVVSPALARDVLDLAHEIGRRVGLFVDRRGRVSRVILGDAHSLELPEFSRVRGVSGRLRGIRLLVTHLVPEPLDREELADLTKLRLDMVAAIHRGAAGITVDLASLTPPPPEGTGAFHTRTFPRTPLSILARADEEAPDAEIAGLPMPLLPFLREPRLPETREAIERIVRMNATPAIPHLERLIPISHEPLTSLAKDAVDFLAGRRTPSAWKRWRAEDAAP